MVDIISTRALKFETLVELLRQRAQEQPHKVVYTFLKYGASDSTATMTYQELDIKAQLISRQLHTREEQQQTRVLLLYPSGLDYIAAYFGCLYAGAVAIPAYPPHSARSLTRIQAIVADAQATIVLTTSSILDKIRTWISDVEGLASLTWITTDTLASEEDTGWQPPNINGQTLAFFQYTSGSTSSPKGVMVTHKNLLHNIQILSHHWQVNNQSVSVSWLPIFHDLGLIAGILLPLCVGSTAYFMAPVDFLQRPLRWLQAISQYQAHLSCAPNFAYELCLRRISETDVQKLDLSNWKAAINGAEPIRSDTLYRFSNFFAPSGFRLETFIPAYGLAENTLLISCSDLESKPYIKNVSKAALEENRIQSAESNSDDIQQLVSCGCPPSDVTVVIVNPETYQVCEPEKVGEIWVKGASMAQGYWQRLEETELTFNAHLNIGEGPFLRTGDLGAFLDDNLFVTGRLKDLIIIGGRNYYPQDIEWTVSECHPAIRAGCCAAFSIEHDREERLVVLAEVNPRYKPRQLDDESPFTQEQLEEEIIKNIRQSVADNHEVTVFKVKILKMGGVLKTSSGKLQRHACRAAFLQDMLPLWRS